MKKVLFIGLVFPESISTAAGSRMMQLIAFFKHYNYELFYASTAKKNKHSDNLSPFKVNCTTIAVNDNSFDTFVKNIEPTIVVFDRYISEEQFGWRIAKHCPNALRILDTEDLHCLRKIRHQAIKQNAKFEITDLLNSEIAKREIASIYRCDLSLIISSFEMELLITIFKIEKSLLYYLPFLVEKITKKQIENLISFEKRQHFISIGNFLHKPNVDAIFYAKKNIWPLIRKQLPTAQFHIYGAYVNQQIQELHNEKDGFLIKGFVKDAQKTIANAKVCLAPLRFGAGIKGKLVEAMLNGTPSVTTSIGAEGMHAGLVWNGFIEDNPQEIASQAIQLYNQKSIWKKSQQNGIKIINQLYDKEKLSRSFLECILNLQTTIKEHRNQNFIGAMLQHHSLQSTKYLSKWIEEKNRK